VWQKLLASGATLVSGSDFPVEEPNPLLGFYAAITRQDPAGNPPGGWTPDQRMTREQALRSFTLDAAYAAHADSISGSLSPGKLADLVMLSSDIMQVPPKEILTTTVRMTIVGGEIVYQTGSGGRKGPPRRNQGHAGRPFTGRHGCDRFPTCCRAGILRLRC
jgi:predicted amidohydrolase YtcJ